MPVHWLARWDGSNLNSIATTATPSGASSNAVLHYRANGDLVAIRSAVGIGVGTSPVVRWDGASWAQLGNIPEVAPVTLHERPSGELVVGGGNNVSLSPWQQALASFDGTSWSNWGALPEPTRNAFAVGTSGELYSGTAAGPGGSAVNRWNGVQWVPVGPPVARVVRTITALADGGLLAGGTFPTPQGDSFAMRWDGVSWTPQFTGIYGEPNASIQGLDGTMYLGGSGIGGFFAVLKFDGVEWVPAGAAPFGVALAFALLPNGELLVGGELSDTIAPSYHVYRWDGSTWSTFGPPLNARVQSLLVQPDGTVLAGGPQLLATPGSQVVKFDGTNWQSLGGGFDRMVTSLQSMPSGDVLATGVFTTAGVPSTGGIARFHGSAWGSVGEGANAAVYRAGLSRDGDLFVSGTFTRFGAVPSAANGRAITACPAQVSSYGSGCIGPAGPLVLTAPQSPWAGSEYRVRAYGMPGGAVGLHAVGVAAISQSLPALLPQSLSGCSLLVTGEILNLFVPVAGVAEPSLRIPDSLNLVGASFYQQVLAV